MVHLRILVDIFVISAHAAALGVAIGVYHVEETTSGVELVAVSSIAMGFHFVYLILYQFTIIDLLNKRNYFKWAEYSITASLGAVAVANSNPDKQMQTGVTMAVFVLGTVQNSFGAVIDHQADTAEGWNIANVSLSRNWVIVVAFLTAVLCQVTEALIVYEQGDPPESLFIVYVVLYGLFGVWCGITVLLFNRAVSSRSLIDKNLYEREVRISEVGYAILGVAAKVTILLVYAATKTDE